jgi:hypothetical protein
MRLSIFFRVLRRNHSTWHLVLHTLRGAFVNDCLKFVGILVCLDGVGADGDRHLLADCVFQLPMISDELESDAAIEGAALKYEPSYEL